MIRCLLHRHVLFANLVKNLARSQSAAIPIASSSFSHFPEEQPFDYCDAENHVVTRFSLSDDQVDQQELPTPSKKPKKKKKTPKTPDGDLDEYLQAKEQYLESVWQSRVCRYDAFLNVCLFSGDFTSARKCLDSFLLRAPRQILQKSVALFNAMFQIHAKSGDVEGARLLLDKLKLKEVPPDLCTISALLQIAASPKNTVVNVEFVREVLDLAEKSDLEIGEIFSARVHGLHETALVLNAVRAVDESFSPSPYTKIILEEVKNLHYDCKLAKPLENPVTYNEYQKGGPYQDLLTDKKALMEKFGLQMKKELSGRCVLFLLFKHRCARSDFQGG